MKYTRIGFALLICSLPDLAQRSTRDFMAKWSYAAPQHHENQVHLRLTLHVWNLGQCDLRDGRLELREHYDDSKRVSVAGALDIGKGLSKTLHVYVDISNNEFRLWESGSKPNLELTFQDNDGNVRKWPVDALLVAGDEQ